MGSWYKPDTAEYIAGIEESMRRVATIEEILEKKKRLFAGVNAQQQL